MEKITKWCCFFYLTFQTIILAQDEVNCDWQPTEKINQYSSPYDNFISKSSDITMMRTVSGKIIDAWTDEPLDGIYIYLDDNIAAITDDSGYYQISINNYQKVRISDPFSRYHDYVRYISSSNTIPHSIEMIPAQVNLTVLKLLTHSNSYPVLKMWDFPVDVYVNEAKCIEYYGNSDCADSVRAAMELIEDYVGINVFNEVLNPLDTNKAGQLGISLDYRDMRAGGSYGNWEEEDDTPRLGFLTMKTISKFVALHEFVHAFEFGHMASPGFLMTSFSSYGTRPTWVIENEFSDFRIEYDLIKTFCLINNFTDFRFYSPKYQSFITPNSGEVWSMDELVSFSEGAITGQYPHYIQNAPIDISEQDKIIINEGTKITVAPLSNYTSHSGMNTTWNIYGEIELNGSSDNIISILSDDLIKGHWVWIGLKNNAQFNARYAELLHMKAAISGWDSGDINISNCLFYGFPANVISVSLYPGYSIKIINCTFDGADQISGAYGAVWLGGFHAYNVEFINNIVLNAEMALADRGSGITRKFEYNFFHNVANPYEQSNISSTDKIGDPQFEYGTPYLLSSSSPAIDSGDPILYDSDGTRSDIGYMHYNQEFNNTPRLSKDTLSIYTAVNDTGFDTTYVFTNSKSNFQLKGIYGELDPFIFEGSFNVDDSTFGMVFSYRCNSYVPQLRSIHLDINGISYPVVLKGTVHGVNGPTFLSNVTGDLTFGLDESPIIVLDDEKISLDEKLVLLPGATMIFGYKSEVNCNAGFSFIGSKESKINLYSDDTLYTYHGIVYSPNDDNLIKHTNFTGIDLLTYDIKMDSCVFNYSGFYSQGSGTIIEFGYNSFINTSVFFNKKFDALVDHCLFTGKHSRLYLSTHFNSGQIATLNMSNSIMWNTLEDYPFISEPAYAEVFSNHNLMAKNFGDLNTFYSNPNLTDKYYLSYNSNCIDAGDSNFPLDPDSTRNDLGPNFYDQRLGIPENYLIQLVSPENNSFIDNDSIQFNWSSLILPKVIEDELNYTFYIRGNKDPENLDSIFLEHQRNHILYNLQDDVLWEWHIISEDKIGHNIQSETFSFITAYPEEPSEFDLLSPQDSDTLLLDFYHFTWTKSIDPDPGQNPNYMIKIKSPPSTIFLNDQEYYIILEEDTTANLDILTLYNSLKNPEDISEPKFEWNVYSISNGDTIASSSSNKFFVRFPTDISSSVELPDNYMIEQNYPNPFNPSTTIKFGLPKESLVHVEIHTILGELINVIVHEIKQAGYHDYYWNASSLSSGVYIYTVRYEPIDGSKQFIQSKKMLLIK